MNKKVIISGATGILGSALVRYNLSINNEVLAIVRKNSKNKKNLCKNKKLTIIECDLSEYNELELKKEYDTFFHLAWDFTTGKNRDNVYAQTLNILYTLDAINLAYRCGCKSFVGTGSQAEYGITDKPLSSSSAVNPQNGYGIAKYAAGKMGYLLCEQLNIKYCWARILSVYGINDHKNSLIMHCISNILEKKNTNLTPCEQTWDYIYCDDAAKALFLIDEKGIHGKSYCIGSGEGIPLKEYLKEIQKVCNSNEELGFGKISYYKNQPMYLHADIKELTIDTGFVPEISFKEGIERTKTWYIKENFNKDDIK